MESLLSRIGSVKRVFSFEIHVHSIEIDSPNSIVKLTWEHRNKFCETQEFLVPASETKFEINQVLSMKNTIYEKSSKFLPKFCKVKLKEKINNEWICNGEITLDLSQYIQKPMTESSFFFNSRNKSITVWLSISEIEGLQKIEEKKDEVILKQLDLKYEGLFSDYLKIINENKQIKESIVKVKQEIRRVRENSKVLRIEEINDEIKQDLNEVRNEIEIQKYQAKLFKGQIEENNAIIEANSGYLIARNNYDENEINKVSSRLQDIIRRHTVLK